HRGLDHALGVALQRLAQALGLEVADVAGEAVVLLVGQLVAGDGHLLRVDHDDVVAGIHVRGVDGLVLAAQAAGDLAGDTAQGLAGGVDHVPVTLYGFGLGAESLHEGTRFGGWSGWLRGPWGRRTFTTRCQSAERKRRNDTVPPGSPQAPPHARHTPPLPPRPVPGPLPARHGNRLRPPRRRAPQSRRRRTGR